VRRAAAVPRNATPLPARAHQLKLGVISVEQSHCVGVMVLTADEKVVAFHALHLEAESLIERLCIEVVGANGQLNASNALDVSLCDCNLQEHCAEPIVTCVRKQSDAKVTNMRSGFAVDWQDIAPADNLPVFQCNELTKIVRDDVPIEGKRLFQRWRLQEGEELLLAGYYVQRVMQPDEMLLSGGKNGVAQDAQRVCRKTFFMR
jgi:hypothetical protein